MGLVVLISIGVIWYFFIDRVIHQKFKVPKRGWSWYKHDNKTYAIFFYLVFTACMLIPFVFPDANLFLLFPFVGTFMNLFFCIEKYIYKKDEKLYIIYLSDALFWFVLGIAAYISFS
ncbi:DUF4181 domain-containing protein [Litchfieldia alkalitelluris]|uniref:DUF4181 domain-containing protein n=1 Tax=Litchfieldia alkalitelluris TaxID=304268 RepID=UPI00099680F8|nr:DUF4181 domain-containing protein [Litchfieldia alkalitelluris]